MNIAWSNNISTFLSIFCGKLCKLCFEGSRKFALALVPDSLCNRGNAHICLPQHFRRLFHAVFFDVRSNSEDIASATF